MPYNFTGQEWASVLVQGGPHRHRVAAGCAQKFAREYFLHLARAFEIPTIATIGLNNTGW